MKLSIINILEDTSVDGPGFRTSIYAAGCIHHCRGCHNPETWNMASGKSMDVSTLADIILEDPFADVTFSGGDPMEQPEGFAELAKLIKMRSDKNIWCYTGYLFEDILLDSRKAKILEHIDVLVDGRFREEEKDSTVYFRGSRNQRLIDVQRSLRENKTILLDYDPCKL